MKTNVSTLPFDKDLLKSTRDNIISTVISTPVPKDATCYLCGGGDLDAAPLVRDCSCLGYNGWAHIQCIVNYAETVSDKNYSVEFSRGWKSCGSCEQPFKNEVAINMSIRFIGYASKKCPENEAIIINAHVQTLRSISNAYITTPRPCYNNKAREMAENIRLKIGQVNLSRESKIYLEAAICNCIGDVALYEGTEASLNEAVRHFETCRDLCQSIGAAVGEACRGLDAAKRLLYPTPSVDDIMSRLEGLTVTNPTQVVIDKHTTTIEAENSENNNKMILGSIEMDWMKDDSEEDNSGKDTIGISLPTTPRETSVANKVPPNKRQKTKSSDQVEIQTGKEASIANPMEQYTLEFDGSSHDNTCTPSHILEPDTTSSEDCIPSSMNIKLICGRTKADRYAQALKQYNSMKDNNVDKSPDSTKHVLDAYTGGFTGMFLNVSAGTIRNVPGRVPPVQVAEAIRRLLPPRPNPLRDEIEHQIFGRSSPGTEEYNTCETQVLNILVCIYLLHEKGYFKRSWKLNPRICLAIGDDRREHHKCLALAEIIKQVYLSDCMEVMVWVNDILRAVYTGEELEYLEAVLSSLDNHKKVTINSVRNFLAGRSLVPVISIINECEVALMRIGEESSHVNPLKDKSEDTPKQKKRNALALQLMSQWLTAGELPEFITKGIARANSLLKQKKDACKDLEKSFRSIIKDEKAGLTSDGATTLLVGRRKSSKASPCAISVYSRSSTDMSEWSAGAIYMDKVPINQLAINIAELILSEILVTEDDYNSLHIFHDFKKRTTLFKQDNDAFVGHLFLITSGETKAAVAARTNRINSDFIVLRTYADLCEQATGHGKALFSRDTDRDSMKIAIAEDKRQSARAVPNSIRKKKMKDFQEKYLSESTLLINSTFKDLSWTRMDSKFRCEVDLVMYPSETTEERNKRLLEEQEKRQLEQEEIKRIAAEKKKRLDQEKMLLATLHRDEADKELDRNPPPPEKQGGSGSNILVCSKCGISRSRGYFNRNERKRGDGDRQCRTCLNSSMQQDALTKKLENEAEDEKTEAEEGKRLENEDDGGTCPYCVGACPVWCVTMYGKV